MSFRRKLTLFLVAIVVVPMVVVGVLLVQVSEDSREGKADAQLATGLETARVIYERALRRAPEEARRVARSAGAALERNDEDELQRLAEREAARPGVAAVEIAEPGGRVLVKAGPIDGLAAAETTVRARSGRPLGTVRVATLEAGDFVSQVNRLTDLEAALPADERVLGSSLEVGDATLPAAGSGEAVDVTVLGEDEYRAAALALEGAPEGTRVVLLAPPASGFVASEPVVGLVLVAFFAVAFMMVFLLLRSMQGRVRVLLQAARRIGQGRFDQPVPVEGRDEMAGLAIELNRMSERLRSQMRLLQRQQSELDDSVKRIGEAFASGLDREALLETVIDTAVSACGAEAGRVVMHDGPGGPRQLAAGDRREDLEGVLRRADAAAHEASGAGAASDAERHAIGHAMVDRRESGRVLCTMSVARTGRPFSEDERGVLRYLIGQTAISIENIGLHERVAEQAVTDELTGLANYRHFSDWIEREMARVARFGGELSLVVIDVDDFKAINDTHGHQQGDRVLEEIGRVLRLESRGVDEAARYGGEEFVLALPETDPESAQEAAERVRRRIELLRIPAVDGGDPVRVTVSAGVATVPGDATDARSLLAAADRGLYAAKAAGKNRVARDGEIEASGGGGGAQGNRPARRS